MLPAVAQSIFLVTCFFMFLGVTTAQQQYFSKTTFSGTTDGWACDSQLKSCGRYGSICSNPGSNAAITKTFDMPPGTFRLTMSIILIDNTVGNAVSTITVNGAVCKQVSGWDRRETSWRDTWAWWDREGYNACGEEKWGEYHKTSVVCEGLRVTDVEPQLRVAIQQSGVSRFAVDDVVIAGILAITAAPTPVPTSRPTTTAPTKKPTLPLSEAPTTKPTASQSAAPTMTPTLSPSAGPTNAPSMIPTGAPTLAPTPTPTDVPSTSAPTALPTLLPTSTPTAELLTVTPTAEPTSSAAPTQTPTPLPAAPTATPTVTTPSPSSPRTETPTKSPTTRSTNAGVSLADNVYGRHLGFVVLAVAGAAFFAVLFLLSIAVRRRGKKPNRHTRNEAPALDAIVDVNGTCEQPRDEVFPPLEEETEEASASGETKTALRKSLTGFFEQPKKQAPARPRTKNWASKDQKKSAPRALPPPLSANNEDICVVETKMAGKNIQEKEPQALAVAVFACRSRNPDELSFEKGDYIDIMCLGDDWCLGATEGEEEGGEMRLGLVPRTFIKIVSQAIAVV